MAIYKKGNNWYIDYYVKGRRKRKKIGPSKKLAEQVLKDVHLKLARGEYLGVYEDKKILFSEFAEKYSEYSRTNKAKSSHEREVTLLKNLVSAFGDKYLFEIDSRMVEEYKTGRIKKVTSATVNRELSCIRHMYTKAVEWGYVRTNPLSGVKQLKEPPGRIRYLSNDEIKALLGACEGLPKDCGVYLQPILAIALNTGLRRGEILNLKWSDVDLEGRKITVFRSKTNELRTLPVNDMLYRELKKYSKTGDGEFMFCNREGIPYNNVRKSFARALKIAGITGFRFHDLRHTFASHLVMSGCDIRTVQQLMGHKEIKMTMRYSHLSGEHLESAVNRIGSSWTPGGHQRKTGEKGSSSKKLVSSGNTDGYDSKRL